MSRLRASGIAGILPAFAFGALLLLLFRNEAGLVEEDPLASARATALHAACAEVLDAPDAGQQARIAEEDRALRQAFADRVARERTGLRLLALAGLALVIALRLRFAPSPAPASGLDTLSRRRARSLLAGAAVAAGGVLAVSLLAPADSARLRPEVAADLPEGWDAHWPAFRGPAGDGVCHAPDLPVRWAEAAGEGVAWKVSVPLPGSSSPIVWGERIFLTGATAQRREAYCFRASDGRLEWTGRYASDPRATKDYPLFEPIAEMLHAIPTPVTDGRRVFALFANGEIACFDAADGRAIWSRFVGDTKENMYGLAASLLLWRGRVIVQFDGAERFLLALDAATGQEAWRSPRTGESWASPVLARGPDGARIWVAAVNDCAAFDPADGLRLATAKILSGDVAVTPLAAGGRIFFSFAGSGAHAFPAAVRRADSPAGSLAPAVWTLDKLDKADFPSVASPVCADGLLYFQAGAFLVCLEAETGKVVYEQELPEETGYASPTLAGGVLFCFGDASTFAVRPGRTFELLATNRLEEPITVSPAFAPGRIYARGRGHLYAIGAR